MLTANCIYDMYHEKHVSSPILVVLSITSKTDFVCLTLSDGVNSAYGILNPHHTKLVPAIKDVVKLNDYYLEWSPMMTLMQVEQKLICITNMTVVSQNSTISGDVMSRSIYLEVPRVPMPLSKGVLAHIVWNDVINEMGLLCDMVLQFVKKCDEQTNGLGWVINDGINYSQALIPKKYLVGNSTVQPKSIYVIRKWFLHKRDHVRVIRVLDFELVTHCRTVLHHSVSNWNKLIKMSSVSDCTKKKQHARGTLLSKHAVKQWLQEGVVSSSHICSDIIRTPLLQITDLHTSIQGTLHAIVSDGSYSWGAVFAQHPQLHQLEQFYVLKIKFAEVVVVSKWQNYLSLYIHDWSIEHTDITNRIGCPRLIYNCLPGPQLQLSEHFWSNVLKNNQVKNPVVQVTDLHETKESGPLLHFKVWDGLYSGTGMQINTCGELHNYGIIKLTDYNIKRNFEHCTFMVQIKKFKHLYHAFDELADLNAPSINCKWDNQWSLIKDVAAGNSEHANMKLRITRVTQRGDNTVSCDAVDANGDSIGICWGNSPRLVEGAVYCFMDCNFARSTKQWCHLAMDYIIDGRWFKQECIKLRDDWTIPKQVYDFKKIAMINGMTNNVLVDICGIILNIVCGAGKSNTLTVGDDSNCCIDLILSPALVAQVTSHKLAVHDIIMIKGGQVSLFDSKTLITCGSIDIGFETTLTKTTSKQRFMEIHNWVIGNGIKPMKFTCLTVVPQNKYVFMPSLMSD